MTSGNWWFNSPESYAFIYLLFIIYICIFRGEKPAFGFDAGLKIAFPEVSSLDQTKHTV